MTALWTPPAPGSHVRAAQAYPAQAYPTAQGYPVLRPARPLWSARRTVLAVLAALTIGALTTVGVSYADSGSSGNTTPRGGLGGPGFGRGGFGQGGPGFGQGGQGFGGQGFGGGGFGQNGFGSGGLGQNGAGAGQPNVQPAPTAST